MDMWYLSKEGDQIVQVDGFFPEMFKVESDEVNCVVYYNNSGERFVLDYFETIAEAKDLLYVIARRLDAVIQYDDECVDWHNVKDDFWTEGEIIDQISST